MLQFPSLAPVHSLQTSLNFEIWIGECLRAGISNLNKHHIIGAINMTPPYLC